MNITIKTDPFYPEIMYFLQCYKCGRKIIVETVLNGSNHNIHVSAVCLECFNITDEFKQRYPQQAGEIEKHVAEAMLSKPLESSVG